MNNTSRYPRVLIIYNSRINKADQHGVSIRGWFGDWPKENLAQIYSGGEVGQEVFCGYNFKLGQTERKFGKYFFKLKDSSIGQSSYPIKPSQGFTKLKKLSFWSLFKNRISKFFINSGLWELIFKPILSEEMIEFIEKFDPQIIYCQGYSLTFSWLPVMIQNKFDIPICFQTGDDWPFYLYKKSPISFVIRPIVHRAVKLLLLKSEVRLANGKLMADVYAQRYNIPFEVIMMCDNLDRFQKAIPSKVVNSDTISIIYTGGLANGRWYSIIDLCKAVEILQNEGYKIMVTTFATLIPQEAVKFLEKLENLQMLPGPSHENLPSYLKGADILYLPESFDPREAKAIRLSISTKAHLYMMSERPILLYASPITGIMNYAKEKEWARIVEEHNLKKLVQAIRLLITNIEYSRKLVKRGLEVVLKNHNEINVREKFVAFLNTNK
jgi:glycosyltransferase involved in cell wall biosynthesis